MWTSDDEAAKRAADESRKQAMEKANSMMPAWKKSALKGAHKSLSNLILLVASMLLDEESSRYEFDSSVRNYGPNWYWSKCLTERWYSSIITGVDVSENYIINFKGGSIENCENSYTEYQVKQSITKDTPLVLEVACSLSYNTILHQKDSYFKKGGDQTIPEKVEQTTLGNIYGHIDWNKFKEKLVDTLNKYHNVITEMSIGAKRSVKATYELGNMYYGRITVKMEI